MGALLQFPERGKGAQSSPQQHRRDGRLLAIFAVLPQDCHHELLDQLRALGFGARGQRATAVLDIIDRGRH